MVKTEDADMDVEAAVAAILTLAVMPQGTNGHDPKDVVQRYKEVLDRLRSKSAWSHRGLRETPG
jgi:hypothetical protein